MPEGSMFQANGLIPEDIFIYVQADTSLRNKFNYAEKVNIEFTNIEGFNREDGLAYPGMSTTITQGLDTLIHKPDIFPELDEGTDLTGLDLINYFRSIFPFRADSAFTLHIRTWDKKGVNSFSFEMPFYIGTNPLIQLTSEGIEYKAIYFFDDLAGESNNANIFYQEDLMILYFEDIQGFTAIEGKIRPALQIIIADTLGHVWVDKSNIFAEFYEDGISPAQLDTILFPLVISLDGGLSPPTAMFHVRLSDLNSDRFLDLRTRIHIMPPKETENPIRGAAYHNNSDD